MYVLLCKGKDKLITITYTQVLGLSEKILFIWISFILFVVNHKVYHFKADIEEFNNTL